MKCFNDFSNSPECVGLLVNSSILPTLFLFCSISFFKSLRSANFSSYPQHSYTSIPEEDENYYHFLELNNRKLKLVNYLSSFTIIFSSVELFCSFFNFFFVMDNSLFHFTEFKDVFLMDLDDKFFKGISFVWITFWTIICFINFLSHFQIISSPPRIKLYIIYFLSTTIQFFFPHQINTYLKYIDVFGSFSLFILDLSLRYVRDYKEPPSMTETGKRPHSLEAESNIWNKALFGWFTPMIQIGSRRPIEETDIWDLNEADKAENILFDYHSLDKRFSIYYRLFSVVKHLVCLQIFFGFSTAILSFSGPYFLNKIVEIMECTSKVNNTKGWWYLFAMFCCAVLKTLNDGQMLFIGRRVGLRIRTILVGEIYEKSLKRPMNSGNTSKNNKGEEMQDKDCESSQGKIVTLISVDTELLREFVSYLQDNLIRLPLSIVLAFGGLILLLGPSAIAGLGTLLVIGPLTSWLAKRAQDLQLELMQATDARVNVTNEVLQGLRIIKYFGWEPQFFEKILKARNFELKKHINIWIVWSFFGILSYGGGVLISITTFAFYTIVQKETLTPAVAFTAMSLLHRLSLELGLLPMQITHTLQMKVSLKRITDYLQETELSKYTIEEKMEDDFVLSASNSTSTLNSYMKVGFSENAKFTYHGSNLNQEEDNVNGVTFYLQDLNIEFPVGKITIICGATGSGKTTIVLALLGEIQRISGQYYLPDPRVGSYYNNETGLLENGVAYCSQTAWCLNSTVRENILFGRPYDKERYNTVIEACALIKDLETLPNGDLTEIGEKGVNISGGQKQRISLARAAYSTATYILLDDPLSAVDAPTAKHLLINCILGPILKGRTVILVTHSLGLTLTKSDKIIVLKNGQVVIQGHFNEIKNEKELLEDIISPEILSMEENCEQLDASKEYIKFCTESSSSSTSSDSSTHTATNNIPAKIKKKVSFKFDDADINSEKFNNLNNNGFSNLNSGLSGKMLDEEEKSSGSVSFSIYWEYIQAAGGLKFLLILLLNFFFMSGADFVFSWWLKQWSDTSSTLITLQKCGNVTNSNNNNTLFAPEKPNSFNLNNAYNEPAALFVEIPNIMGDTGYYLKYYAMIGVIVMIVNNLNMIIQLFGVVVASRKLHSKLLLRVLNAPIKFFETTPIGRILNRFSKDISGIDQNVMYTIGAFIQTLFRICAILILICAVTPYFILFLIPIVFVYIIIAKKYLKVSRELKRLEAISRSPIYSQFSETLIGVSTIRAYGQEQRFLDEAYKRLDSNHRAYFFLWVSNRWLSIRTDLISSFVVFISGAAMLYGHLPPGWAALTMSYSLDLCEAFLWVIRSHADMEMAMNSVERVQEYSTIEQEAPAVIEGRRPPSNWPTAGVVEVKNLYVQYSPESPAVLRDLSFTTKKFEKIGIVGRTGAGKSTLSLAFFRIFKFAEGSITIDGIDVEQIGLRDLRSKLTIIPQDPILFTGTLRSNLDPVGDHDDAEIWGALKRVHFLDSLQDVSASNEEVTPDSSEEGTVVEDNLINIDETPFEERPVFNEENCSLLSKNSFDGAESLNSSNSNFRISLDAFVSENGSNFSQGQRQLLCLARALLKISKLIILDEATASVDNLTDLRIQETIRSEFVNSTVLSIAHRLRTVIDYDRILVLDQGEIVEFDSPYLLMEKRGYFYKMCEESGELDDLYEAAKLKHDSIVN